MNAASERRLTRPLAAAALLLGVLLLGLFAGLGRAVRWPPPRPVPPLPTTSRAAALPAPVPLEQFAAVWQHPLFSPDRKPTVHGAGNNSNLGAMQLTGIILTRGLRMALLHDKKSGQEVRVHEGDALPDGSWTLTQVRARSALFDSSSGRAELKLPAGAPIDNARSQSKAAAGEQQPSPRDQQSGVSSDAANTWTSNGQGGQAKPEQPPGADQGNPAAGASDQDQSNPDEPAAEQEAPPAEPPAPAASQAGDQQAERIQRLRETILKRRAAQAAAAAHEGDH
jgi:general secretion pathway protein N